MQTQNPVTLEPMSEQRPHRAFIPPPGPQNRRLTP
jgi:hypothetical protein